MVYIDYEPRPNRDASHGFARMVREENDGCSPHVLTPWRCETIKSAKARAKREGATFRNVGA